ncbi:MAG: hypothetical protein AB7I19_10955 [Planctomycetota bacterium]
MTFLNLTTDRSGLPPLRPGLQSVARDDSGLCFVADERGRVFSFDPRDESPNERSADFESTAQMHTYIEHQHELRIPEEGETLTDLRARLQRVREFKKLMRRSRYAGVSIALAVDDLKEAIADRKFDASPAGRNLAARRVECARCEAVLHAATGDTSWMIRPHASDSMGIGVIGSFRPPWTESAVRDLIAPTMKSQFELHCLARPQSTASSD